MGERVTDDQLAEWRSLLAEAESSAPGPWVAGQRLHAEPVVHLEGRPLAVVALPSFGLPDYGLGVAKLIAVVPTALHALLNEVERVHRIADQLAAFDCEEDEVPHRIDVPDDYETGLHDAARRIRGGTRG